MRSQRVLVVENEGIVALDIEEYLVSLGYSVSVVPSGEEAIAAVALRRPDVVVMNVQIGGSLDGIQAAEQIKKATGVPLIFLTAYSDRGTLERAAKVEPSGYIVKPFDEKVLGMLIHLALHGSQPGRSDLAGDRSSYRTLESVVDDIRTLVGVIRANGHLALHGLPLGQDVRPSLVDIQQAAEELASICR